MKAALAHTLAGQGVKMKKVVLFLLVITAGTSDAFARFEDGNKLQELCLADSPFVLGYAIGVADGIMESAAPDYTSPTKGPLILDICLPAGVRAGQVQDVVCHYLYSHPETRHESAWKLSVRALKEAWPCK